MRPHVKMATDKWAILVLLIQFGHSVVCNSSRPMDHSTPGTLSITSSQSLLQLMSMESVMPSNHLILCRPLLLLALNLSQHQGLFQQVSSLHEVAKILKVQFQHQSFQRIFRVDFLQDGLI